VSDVTDLDWWAATRYPAADDEWGAAGGRHAINEDAELTPIFHALTRTGWRKRQQEPAAPPSSPSPPQPRDPVAEFRRDPLTAPIPTQAFRPPARRRPLSGRERPARLELSDTGRHHHRRGPHNPRW
jgi:hypothetical protein